MLNEAPFLSVLGRSIKDEFFIRNKRVYISLQGIGSLISLAPSLLIKGLLAIEAEDMTLVKGKLVVEATEALDLISHYAFADEDVNPLTKKQAQVLIQEFALEGYRTYFGARIKL